MYKIGMIGINSGNGHPYSYSAVFNGFDTKALEKYCEYEIIIKYLKEFHTGQNFIPNARITHIWTQCPEKSKKIAAVSLIPNISNSIAELVEEVDAIIFARDDVWNHWEMSKDIFASRKPLFMDKLLTPDPQELAQFAELAQGYPLMTSGSFRWSPSIKEAAEKIDFANLATIHGVSPCTWDRYSPHLIEPIFALLGNDIESVQNAGQENSETVILTYRNGVQAVLQVFDKINTPLELTFRFRDEQAPYVIQSSQPTLKNYFFAMVTIMQKFAEMLTTGITPTPLEETLFLNKVVIAAIESRNKNGEKITFVK